MLTLTRAKHDRIHKSHYENQPNKHGVASDAPVGALQVCVVFGVSVRSSSYHSQPLPVLMANSRRRISVTVSDEFTTRQPAAKPVDVHSGSRLADCHLSMKVSVWADSQCASDLANVGSWLRASVKRTCVATLYVVGVCLNRIGTVHTSTRPALKFLPSASRAGRESVYQCITQPETRKQNMRWSRLRSLQA